MPHRLTPNEMIVLATEAQRQRWSIEQGDVRRSGEVIYRSRCRPRGRRRAPPR